MEFYNFILLLLGVHNMSKNIPYSLLKTLFFFLIEKERKRLLFHYWQPSRKWVTAALETPRGMKGSYEYSLVLER